VVALLIIHLAAVLLLNISTCFDVGEKHLLPVALLGEDSGEKHLFTEYQYIFNIENTNDFSVASLVQK
jgi:hypothetical protein